MNSLYSEMRKQLAALTASADQAQALIEEARSMPYLAPSFHRDLDRQQIRVNVQRAEIRNLQSQIDILEGNPLRTV